MELRPVLPQFASGHPQVDPELVVAVALTQGAEGRDGHRLRVAPALLFECPHHLAVSDGDRLVGLGDETCQPGNGEDSSEVLDSREYAFWQARVVGAVGDAARVDDGVAASKASGRWPPASPKRPGGACSTSPTSSPLQATCLYRLARAYQWFDLTRRHGPHPRSSTRASTSRRSATRQER